jgi:hypothetical protein
MEFSGARGKLIYEKNLKSKISCQTPFTCTCSVNGGINKLKEDFLNPEYEEKNPQDRHLLNTFKNEILKQNK